MNEGTTDQVKEGADVDRTHSHLCEDAVDFQNTVKVNYY